MLVHEPDHPQWLSLGLTPDEKERAIKLALDLWLEYRPRTFWEWIWCLAVDGVRPRKRGNKPKWSGIDGDYFEAEVEIHRMKLGDKKESIADSIRAVMLGSPEHYGIVNDATVETMRQNYYKIQGRIWGAENRKKRKSTPPKPKKSLSE
jgi:hypothetical protein